MKYEAERAETSPKDEPSIPPDRVKRKKWEVPAGLNKWVESLGEGLGQEEQELLRRIESAGGTVDPDLSEGADEEAHEVTLKLPPGEDAAVALAELGLSGAKRKYKEIKNVARADLPFDVEGCYVQSLREGLSEQVKALFESLGQSMYPTEKPISQERAIDMVNEISTGSPEGRRGLSILLGEKLEMLSARQKTLQEAIMRDARANPLQSEHLGEEDKAVIERFRRVLAAGAMEKPGDLNRRDPSWNRMNFLENGTSPKMAAEFLALEDSMKQIDKVREALRFFNNKDRAEAAA